MQLCVDANAKHNIATSETHTSEPDSFKKRLDINLKYASMQRGQQTHSGPNNTRNKPESY